MERAKTDKGNTDPPQQNDKENEETREGKEDKEPQVSEQEQHQKLVNNTRYYWSLLDLVRVARLTWPMHSKSCVK